MPLTLDWFLVMNAISFQLYYRMLYNYVCSLLIFKLYHHHSVSLSFVNLPELLTSKLIINQLVCVCSSSINSSIFLCRSLSVGTRNGYKLYSLNSLTDKPELIFEKGK